MDLLQAIKSPCTTNLDGASANLFLTLINTLMAAQCRLGSKDPYPEDYGSKLSDNEEFDFIIVGGGASGSVVANQLSENLKWRVLVLEAGGFPSATSEIPGLLFNLQGTEEDWQYKTETSDSSCKAYKDEQCRWPRGKALGGSSTINAMIYNRGNSRDYDEWEKEGNPGWSYKDLKVNFNKIENVVGLQSSHYYGKGGPQSLSWYHNKEPISHGIANGAKELGYPSLLEQNPEKPLGYYQALFSTEQGVRVNAAKAFLGQARLRNNLHIVTKAHVRKVIIDETLTAKGVKVEIGDRILTVLAKKEVILSAGALNTPQILMLSGIGPGSQLEKVGIKVLKELPGVGENLQDHVIVPIFLKVKENAYNQRPANHLLDDMYSYFLYRTGPMATIHITNLLGFVNTKNDSIYPNIQLQHIGHRSADNLLLPLAYHKFGFQDATLFELRQINTGSGLVNVVPVLLNPKSRGRVELASANPLDSPKFYSGYFSDKDGDDMKTMIEGIGFVRNLFKTSPLQVYSPEYAKLTLSACDGDPVDSDKYWQCFIKHFATTIYHQVGTAKMGPSSDKMAVVDEKLKVHGVNNLRVIDASIMPKIISGNTYATCLVIGHKGGEMIVEDWKVKEGHQEL